MKVEENLHEQTKKSLGTLEDIFMLTIPKEICHPNKQYSVNTTR